MNGFPGPDWPQLNMSYAPPIVHDPFSCSGDSFYVTIDGHRHQRASSETLYQSLTYTQPDPVLTKAGKVAKRQPAPHRDPPGHFYCAQLLHYGLKPLKTKDAAKRHLLAAFGADGQLSVPNGILELEKTLRHEYRQANDIAKKKYEEEKRAREIERERRLQKHRDAITQAFADDHDQDYESPASDSPGEFDFESVENDISNAHLLDAIADLPEERLRELLARLVDEIPAAERALRQEVRKLHNSGLTTKTSRVKDEGKGKRKGEGEGEG